MAKPSRAALERAEKIRVSAAYLRETRPAMRTAESASCAGLTDVDRDTSPFDSRADVLDVAPAGAEPLVMTITLRHVPGLTEARLDAILQCHIARNEAAGHRIVESRFCPLDVPGVQAGVQSDRLGWVVVLRARDEQSFLELRSRAEVLHYRGDALDPGR